jgi:hypothetical protein
MSYTENYDKLIENLGKQKFEGKTIIVDGPDFSGKSTLINRLLKETNIATTNFFSNRGFLTNVVYANFYNRNIDVSKQLLSLQKQLFSNKYIYIVLLPDDETLISRLSRGDEFIDTEKKVIEIADLFRGYAFQLMSSSNVIVVTKDHLIMQNNFNYPTQPEVVFDWHTMVNTLVDLRNIYNYNLSYSFTGPELKAITETLPHYYEKLELRLTDSKYEEYLNPNYRLTYAKDIYDQEMLLNQLKFNAHIQMDVFNQKVNSRRFIASNIVSCLTNYQVNIDEQLNFHISAAFRSSDAINLLLHDINFIFKAAKDFYFFLYEYKFKDLQLKDVGDTEFHFDINLNNVHIRQF